MQLDSAVHRYLDILAHHVAGGITEVSIAPGSQAALVGYFDTAEKAAQAIATYDSKYNVYVTLNPVRRDLLARVNNKLTKCKNRTADADILCDSWFFFDIDPKRPSGISSTDAELQEAISVGKQIVKYLFDIGVTQESILTGISGNGAYVLVRLPDYEITRERVELKKRLLNLFADHFSTATIEIDRTVYNPARLVGALGTLKMKGESIAERPHRHSEIRTIGGLKFDPSLVQRCVPFNLYALADVLLPPEPKRKPASKASTNGQPLDVEQWMAKHGLEVANVKQWNGTGFSGRLYVLRACPFNPDHNNKSAFIIQADNGALIFGCHHNSCAGKNWRELRAMFEPERIKQDSTASPRQQQDSAAQSSGANAASGISGVYVNLNDFFNASFEEPEEIIYGVHRGEVAGLLAVTNYGKTTLLCNTALSIAAGERLWPLAPIVPKPRHVLYIDSESPASRSRADMQTMIGSISDCKAARENFAIVVDAAIKDSPFSLSNPDHFNWLVKLAKHLKVDLVIIDTAASAFELIDENNNAEVTRRVMNPLKRLAREANCAVVFTHHIGKATETQTGEAAYKGRGASAFGALSRTIFTIEKDAKKGPGYIVLNCAKIKGQPFESVLLKLDSDTRWFEICDDSPSAKPEPPTAQEIAGFVKKQADARTSDICDHFKTKAGKRTIEDRIKESERLGLIYKENQKAPWRFRNSQNGDSGNSEEILAESTGSAFPQSANPIRDCGNAETGSNGQPEEPATVASVPFMITREQRQQLADLGYTRSQIYLMTPEVAQAIITSQKLARSADASANKSAICAGCGSAGLLLTHCDRCGEFLRG